MIGDTLHVSRRDTPVAREVLLEVAGVSEEGCVGVQLVVLAAEAADGLQAVDEPGLARVVGALHLFGRGARGLYLRYLVID